VQVRWKQHGIAIVVSFAVTVACIASVWASTLDLPVPRVTLYPGDVVTGDQLTDRAFIASTVTRGSVFEGRQNLVGKVAKRTLLAGQPIPLNAIREPFLVTQGKSSLVVFETGGLTITIQAVALQNGSVGEIVTLRNPDSGVIIHGTVERDGTVRLGAQ
jgi:flagella basal body P-ring formation protein FlgA